MRGLSHLSDSCLALFQSELSERQRELSGRQRE